MKRKLKKFICGVLLGSIILSQGMSASAATSTKHDYYSAYSAANIRVAYVDFMAEGDTSTHQIYDYKVNDISVAILNSLEDEKTWVSTFPTYKRASYSSTHKFGVPTPWGTVGYTYTKVNLYCNF